MVGGFPAPAGSAPWAAFIEYFVGGGEVELCSGTVVAPTLVLTAGHCAADETTGVPNQPAQYRVYTGGQNWDAAGEQTSGVASVSVYGGFRPASADGDAALLQLSTPTTAPAITLASPSTDAALVTPGTPALIDGFGLTSPGGAVSQQLESGQEVVQSAAYCDAQLAGANYPFDSSDELCAIDYPSFADTGCSGDSGGPLLAQEAGGALVEIGVTSHGSVSCSTNEPQVFTSVPALYGWIEDAIEAVATPAPSPAPTATTGAASDVSTDGALLNGQVDPDGAQTSYYFQYGTDSSYGSQTPTLSAFDGTAALPVESFLAGLTPATTYHYRLVATSAGGTAYGADQTFTTVSAPVVTVPTVTTTAAVTTPTVTVTSGAATTPTTTPTGTTAARAPTPTVYPVTALNVRRASARLSGSIAPGGAPAAYYFQYGPGTRYERRSRIWDSSGKASLLRAAVTVTGLEPATDYRFRLVVRSGGRIYYSRAKRFRTKR